MDTRTLKKASEISQMLYVDGEIHSVYFYDSFVEIRTDNRSICFRYIKNRSENIPNYEIKNYNTGITFSTSDYRILKSNL